jgi:RNA polymerase sigma-70 factor (ECF subfamily)
VALPVSESERVCLERVSDRSPARSGVLSRASSGDAALVRAARRGSEDAVEQLFRRHWRDLYRAALLITGDRAAAEDIAQEAFLAALRALPRFDVRRPLRPWLHRIAVNRSIDWSRARSLRREVIGGQPDDIVGHAQDGEGDREPVLSEAVVAALLQLGVEQRAVVVLRHVLEFTPGEIAAVLDLPRGTVNSRLRRGLDLLGELLVEQASPRTQEHDGADCPEEDPTR